jgi:hypothetical protein
MNRHYEIFKTLSGPSTGKSLLNHTIFSASQTGETVPFNFPQQNCIQLETLNCSSLYTLRSGLTLVSAAFLPCGLFLFLPSRLNFIIVSLFSFLLTLSFCLFSRLFVTCSPPTPHYIFLSHFFPILFISHFFPVGIFLFFFTLCLSLCTYPSIFRPNSVSHVLSSTLLFVVCPFLLSISINNHISLYICLYISKIRLDGVAGY